MKNVLNINKRPRPHGPPGVSANRQDHILHLLKQRTSASLSEMAEHFGVSEMTVRRDVDKLSQGGEVIRIPGGARITRSITFEETFAERLESVEAQRQVRRALSQSDGCRVKLVSAVGVGDQPLILSISRDEEQALRPWRDEVRSAALRTVLLSLLIVVVTWGLLQQFRKLRQSEERYAMTMEAANEGHCEWNVSEDKIFLSEKWRSLHGYGQQERF